MLKKGLTGLTGILLSAIAISTPNQSIAEHIDLRDAQSNKPTYTKTERVKMRDEFGPRKSVKLETKVKVEEGGNRLVLTVSTENYDKKNWGGKERLLPKNERYTPIEDGHCEVFVLYPPEVKISKIKQYAWLSTGGRKWVEVKPLEESPNAQRAMKFGEAVKEKILDLGDVQIPGTDIELEVASRLLDKFVARSEKKSDEEIKERFERIARDYSFMPIPLFPPNKTFGYQVTARMIFISLDTSNTTNEVPIYLWSKFALGEPGNSSSGERANQEGSSDPTLWEFTLGNSKIPESRELEIRKQLQGTWGFDSGPSKYDKGICIGFDEKYCYDQEDGRKTPYSIGIKGGSLGLRLEGEGFFILGFDGEDRLRLSESKTTKEKDALQLKRISNEIPQEEIISPEVELTRKRMQQFGIGASVYDALHGGRSAQSVQELLKPCRSLKGSPYIPPSATEDAWGTPIKYSGNAKDFGLRSAGPDKTFETEDDITR